MNVRRVAVFGGSFDPVHRGHLNVAERALPQASLDAVWFLPAASAPHKPRGARVGAEDRCRMIEIAIEGRSGLELCRHEVELGRSQRSVDTLAQLTELHPGVEFFFLMGEDSFRELDGWKDPARLVELAPLLVQPRPGSQGEHPSRYAGRSIRWLEGEEIDISSTDLRRKLVGDHREAIAERLPAGVLEYIESRGLYLDGGSC